MSISSLAESFVAIAIVSTAPPSTDAPFNFKEWLANLPAQIGEATLAMLATHGVALAIAVFGGLPIYLLLSWAKGWFGRRAERAEAKPKKRWISGVIFRAISKTPAASLIIISVSLAFLYANLAISSVFRVFLTAAMIFQTAYWLRDIFVGFVQHRATSRDNRALTNALTIIRFISSVVLFGVAGILVLDNIGVDVTGLIAGLGIGGIAIGLAAQGIFSDLFSSLSIILDNPFRKGDTISFDGTMGTVETIGLKSTKLRSINGELLVVSNSSLLNKEIANYARLERRRVVLLLGFVYQTTPKRLREAPKILEELVVEREHAFVRAGFTGFGSSSLDFELVFEVLSEEYDKLVAARTDVGVAVFETLTKAGYEFAYPTQTTFTAAPDGSMVLPYPQSWEKLV